MALGPLSKDLIEKAIQSPAGESRALATQAIGRLVRDYPLSDSERRLTHLVFDILSRDVTEEVRRALAITLRLSKNLPPAIANRLINDVDSIAVPILASSPVVTDEDLIAVLESRATAKLQAVASRQGLSRSVSRAIIQSGDPTAVTLLAANDTTLISPEDAEQLVVLSHNNDLIREAALRRQDMPQDLAVKLIDHQVATVDDNLIGWTDHHNQIARDTGARAKASWSAQDWSSSALTAYVTALMERGQLGDAVIGRAAGQGDWRFVQLALAALSGITPAKAGMMVLDGRPHGLSALLARSSLGPAARALVQVSATAFRDMERSQATMSRAQFQRLMSERIASHPAADQYGDMWLDWLDSGLGPQRVA